ncbi:uncharacterized protein LOC127462127 [Manacus candei]|uniref:uncharacterized protein LOC127462127 n=1 Tax=Manacus candei TaxID=415023 RepID=UPI002227B6A2|nr:uncharacterized protein LOC127462127 [Manacus candei]
MEPQLLPVTLKGSQIYPAVITRVVNDPGMYFQASGTRTKGAGSAADSSSQRRARGRGGRCKRSQPLGCLSDDPGASSGTREPGKPAMPGTLAPRGTARCRPRGAGRDYRRTSGAALTQSRLCHRTFFANKKAREGLKPTDVSEQTPLQSGRVALFPTRQAGCRPGQSSPPALLQQDPQRSRLQKPTASRGTLCEGKGRRELGDKHDGVAGHCLNGASELRCEPRTDRPQRLRAERRPGRAVPTGREFPSQSTPFLCII